MTTVLAQAPSSDTPATDPTAKRRAVLALARVETVRLLRHPLTLAAILFLLGFWVAAWFTNQANHFPVLQDMDRDSQLGMMLLPGGAALVVSNLAVLRAHRDGTTNLGRVLVLPDASRTAAHLLALLPLVGLGGALILARIAVLAVVLPAAGHPDPYELAAGPATVLLLGALGVLLGRLSRSAIAAPLAVLALLASLVVLPMLPGGSTARWLQPVVPQNDAVFTLPAPAYLMARPAGAHLGYLLGLAGLFAVGALLRAGGRGIRVAVAGLAALACVAAGAAGQAGGPGPATAAARAAAMNHPSQHQTCRPLDGVTYCAFADFSGWVPAWNTVVQLVLARVPATARPAALVVRQHVVVLGPEGQLSPDQVVAAWRADDTAAGTPRAVTVSTQWGDSRSAADLAALVGYRVVTSGTADRGGAVCGGAGVLAVWLAGQAGPLAATGLHKLIADQRGPAVMFSRAGVIPGFAVPREELTVALAALDRPVAQTAERVQRSWTALTAAGTSAAQAARILGVPAPPPSGQGAPPDSPQRC